MRRATAAARHPNLSEQAGFSVPEVWNAFLSGLPYNATPDERTLRAVQHAKHLASYPAFSEPIPGLSPEFSREDIGNRMLVGAVMLVGNELLLQRNGHLRVKEGDLPVDRQWLLEGKVDGKSIMQDLMEEYSDAGDYENRREAIGGLNKAVNRAERIILGGFEHLSRPQIIALQAENYKALAGLLTEHMAKQAFRANGFPLTSIASVSQDVHFGTDVIVRRKPADYVGLQIKSPKNTPFSLDQTVFPVRASIPLFPDSPNPRFEMQPEDTALLVDWADRQLQ
jgi:hypothetical protein